MTGSDEREGGVPADTTGTNPEPSKEQRKAAKRAAKGLKKQARAVQRVAKQARKAARAEAAASAKAARAAAKAEAKSAKADAKARKSAKAQAKAGKKTAKGARRATSSDDAAPPAISAARAVLEEAAGLMRHADAGPSDGTSVAPQAPEAAPEAEPEAETAAEPEVGTAPEAEPEAETEAEPEAATELAGEPAAQAEPEAAPDAKGGPAAQAEPEAAPDAEGGPAPQAEPEAETEAAVGPAAARGTLAETGAYGAEAAPEAQPAEPEAPRESGTEPTPEADVEPALLPRISAGEVPAPVGLLAEAFEPQAGAAQVVAHPGSQVAASIDVGATSVHLLVGAIDGHRVAPLLDESEFLGLGDRVAAEGYLGDALRAPLVAVLGRYATRARELGATTITIVGTDPLRRAADGPAVVREVEGRIGVPLHVLDHAEEGLLTLIGATGGSPVSGELLLVDIGGGSSEFVAVGLDGLAHAVGLPLGAARLTRELVRSDPPSLAEIEALRREVARVIGDAPEASPAEIVAVGGTASNLLRLLPATAVDRSLTRRRIAVALAMLTVERSGEAATRHLIRPERARILPAGAIIVDAVLERYRADRLRVSEAGIREGAILAPYRGGSAWRDRLALLALGWTEAHGSE